MFKDFFKWHKLKEKIHKSKKSIVYFKEWQIWWVNLDVYQVEYENQQYSVILSQLRLISSKRLLRKIRKLSSEDFKNVRNQIKSFL